MKYIYFLFFLFCVSCGTPTSSQKKTDHYLVSIAPHKYLVEKISGGEFSVQVFVPAGASPHTYEPNARDMGKVAQSDVWFLAGESFEEKMLPKVKEQCPGLIEVSLLNSLPGLLKDKHCCHHGHTHSMIDNHVWLSPSLYLEQGKIILETLVKRYPERKLFFEENYNVLVDEVNQLDFELNKMRKELPKDIAILVSHPAFSYFSIDYDLLQLSVEQDGREPQPKDIEKLIRQVSDSNVVCVLLQEQYNNKGTRLIAEYLSLPMYTIDPYDEDALGTIRELGNTIFISKE